MKGRGASESDLRALEATMPEAHLAPLWAMYERIDGTGEGGWFGIDPELPVPHVRWVSAARCLENSRGYAEHFGGVATDPPYAFFGYFDGGCLLGVERETGRVWYFDPIADGESARNVELATTLEAWLERLADLVEQGRRIWDEDEGDFINAQAEAPIAAHTLTELELLAVKNTLSFLVEGGLLTLPVPPSGDDLLRLQAALSKRGVGPRARALRTALARLDGAKLGAEQSVLEECLRILG
jgi:hypothetical protein